MLLVHGFALMPRGSKIGENSSPVGKKYNASRNVQVQRGEVGVGAVTDCRG